jgi:hypothetical protein
LVLPRQLPPAKNKKTTHQSLRRWRANLQAEKLLLDDQPPPDGKQWQQHGQQLWVAELISR